jgi:NADP-dependent alcohol dehydrogenase
LDKNLKKLLKIRKSGYFEISSGISVKCKQKHEKLLQYGKLVWNIMHGSDDEKIDQTIIKTREFFESVDIKTRLSDYNIDLNLITDLVKQFRRHDIVALDEFKILI